MSQLFSPFQLGPLRLKNRIAVSPMCQYAATDGVPNAWHLVHLGSRAVGGASLVLAEATAVAPEGRITPGCTGLWSEAQAAAFAPLAAFVRAQGALPGIQLAHAGRKGSTEIPWAPGGGQALRDGRAWVPVAPSALPFAATYPLPRALATAELPAVVAQFARAAELALAADFAAIELHAAHGYLLHEFLSPVSNRRTDGYGGPLENRARLLLEVTAAVRAVWPNDRALLVRLSCTDWAPPNQGPSLALAEAVQVAAWLRAAGVDLVDCSSRGNLADQQIPIAPGYQVPFAAAIRGRGVPSGAVGLITEPAQAEAILVEGQADLILLARALLRDPYWPLHAAQALGDDVSWPSQYLRAKPT